MIPYDLIISFIKILVDGTMNKSYEYYPIPKNKITLRENINLNLI